MSAGFTFNKALGAGVGGVVSSTFLLWLADALHFIQPMAAMVFPGFGLLVGFAAGVVTYFTKKNAEPEPKMPSS